MDFGIIAARLAVGISLNGARLFGVARASLSAVLGTSELARSYSRDDGKNGPQRTGRSAEEEQQARQSGSSCVPPLRSSASSAVHCMERVTGEFWASERTQVLAVSPPDALGSLRPCREKRYTAWHNCFQNDLNK